MHGGQLKLKTYCFKNMYTQKHSYFLVKNHYKLVSKKYSVSYIHKEESRVKISLTHLWKSPGLKRQIFTIDLGFFNIDPKYIKTRKEDRLASNDFQTDDMYYSVQIRYIDKKQIQKVIESLNLK